MCLGANDWCSPSSHLSKVLGKTNQVQLGVWVERFDGRPTLYFTVPPPPMKLELSSFWGNHGGTSLIR